MYYTQPTDMRKSYNALSGIVSNVLGCDPCYGSVYIFMNRARNRIKLLHWEPGGMVIYPAQLLLFDQKEMSEEEKAALEEEVKKAEETITYSVTRKAKPSRKPLDTSKLPVQETHIYPEGTCDENGNLKPEYVEIGTEESRVLETVPSRVFIHSTIRHKVILKSEVENKLSEDRKILIADLPLQPVSRCIAGASVLTDIIIGKFMYHLPLIIAEPDIRLPMFNFSAVIF